MDFVLLPKTEVILRPGKLFIEGRIRADARDDFDSDSIAEVSGEDTASTDKLISILNS